jgi:hypothetical protein
MIHTKISGEFLLWSELCLLWAIISYGISADPLRDEANSFRWHSWKGVFVLRCISGAAITFLMSRSVLLGLWMLATFAYPLLRFRMPPKWTGESECVAGATAVGIALVVIRYFHLSLLWTIFSLPVNAEQLSALCIVAGAFVFVVRGETYIVRGYLKKAGTIPHLPITQAATLPSPVISSVAPVPQPSTLPLSGISTMAVPASEGAPEAGAGIATETLPGAVQPSAPSLAGAVNAPQAAEGGVDIVEFNRGRLIGNIERIILTIVVAAGSYAALGFLVAAKGLIRSEEFEQRDFTEYFLIGSLSSVLIALCAGLVIRYVLVALWPELLTLQMQSSGS